MSTDLFEPKRPGAALAVLATARERLFSRVFLARAISCGIFAAVWMYFVSHEWPVTNIVFTLGVTTALISVLLLASQRLLFSTASVAGLVVLIIAISEVKRHYVGMALHAFDIFFYLLSPDTLSFLWADFRLELLGLAGAVTGLIALGWLLYRLDPTRVSRGLGSAAVILSVATAAWAAENRGGRHQTLFYWGHHYVSSFYLSWAETVETLWRGQLIEAAPYTGGTAPFAAPATCRPGDRPPNIILIHQESVFPPSYFPGISYDKGLDPFFRSADGKLHKLRVETYGGASWLTEFSVLAGVSTF